MSWLLALDNNKVVEGVGIPAILEQGAEECNELSQALLKYSRKMRGENPTPKTEEEIRENLKEELADMLLCLDYILHISEFDREDIIDIIVKKQIRWIERIDEKENTDGLQTSLY